MSDSTAHGNPNKPFLIGVAGGTASGKSTVCDKIIEQLGQTDVSASQRKVVCISQDSFYKQLAGPFSASNNYDHPNSLDQDLMYQTLQDILEGKIVQVPVYDYVKSCIREGEYLTIYPADVVLFEGILAFYFPTIRDLFHMKLFVDTDPDTRLSHRVQRDVNERGRKLDTVLDHYIQFVKPAFEEFCLPTKKFADVIIPRGADNLVAISLIVQHIQDLLWSRNGPDAPSATACTSASASTSNGSTSFRSSSSLSQGSNSNTKRRLVKELSRPH